MGIGVEVMRPCIELIAHLLAIVGRPLGVPEIEWQLKAAGHWSYDTFDVRDAVHELIRGGRAEYVHPGRLVVLK